MANKGNPPPHAKKPRRKAKALAKVARQPHEGSCGCELCQNRKRFDMPSAIVDAAIDERLVIFAGSGVSTESRTVLKDTFYDEVRAELKVDPSAELSFPELMSMYCAQPDGRIKLLRSVRARFDYIDSFPELLRQASQFHNELATIPQITEIVTTNWDPYFERYTAATSFVHPQDFAGIARAKGVQSSRFRFQL
jgi:hypothetical protein